MNAFFVIKRDGSRIGFDLQRITNAIKKQQVRSILLMKFISMI